MTETNRSVPDESRHVSLPGTRTFRRAPMRSCLSFDLVGVVAAA
jgi:hypothetical protein